MPISYFRSTWAASCVASTAGAFYAAVMALLITRGRIEMMEILLVVLISIVVSLPVLIVGSAMIGWWTTKFLSQHVRTNRLFVFALAGMCMGLIADAILLALGFLFFEFSLRGVPRTMDELIDVALAASIPVFCLTLAGLVAGTHVTHREQDSVCNR